MNYSEAIEKVLSLTDMERMAGPSASRYNLDRIYRFLERLGNPHLRVPSIHIAGTKGKGSTANMINSILLAQGYSTGLYTSPHLHAFRERIAIGREPIEESYFTALVERLWPVVEETAGEERVTTFEMLTAMAFTAFTERGLDFQVLEVGLGGRLDATNVIDNPLVCIITSISLDHMKVLGNTLEEIAREKADILKPGAIGITAPQAPEALAVIQDKGRGVGSGVIDIGNEYTWKRRDATLDGQSFTVDGPHGSHEVWIPLLGGHQLENATLAIAAAEALNTRGILVDKQAILKGLREVKWPGRLEVLSAHPLIVVDGAHNVYSMKRLCLALKEYFHFRRVILVFGASGDKDLDGMVNEVAGLQPRVIATSSRHPRSVVAGAIAGAFGRRSLEATLVESVGKATRVSMDMAEEDDLVLVTGSLYVVAEAIEELHGIKPELYPISEKPTISYQRTG